MCGIYLITNTITKKVYIGQSNNMERRWSEHMSRAFDPNNNCYDKPLYRSIRKHGKDKFTLTVLCECTEEELNQKEEFYIQQYNCIVPNGYNVLSGGKQGVSLRRICKSCGKILNYTTEHSLCRECYTKSTRIVERPSPEELVRLLKASNFVQVGKMFGVTDNAIRKWCKAYGLPTHAKDYK